MAVPALELDPTKLAVELSGVHCYDGKLVPSIHGNTIPIKSPATLQHVGYAAAGDADDVQAAVSVAVMAHKTWKKTPAKERGRLVSACAQALSARQDELSRLLALETGKAIRTECRPECKGLPDVFTFFGGLWSELVGTTVPFSPEMLTMTVRESVGVVGCIIPWNVPLLLMAIKIAPAIVAGNTVVVKASEYAPFTALRLVQVLNSVLPPGIVNLLCGDGTCGAALVDHTSIAKVSFTGSVATGKLVNVAAAKRLVPATLELGGKSPMIVHKDANLEATVAGAVSAMRFTRAGQSCSAASRIYVHQDIIEDFMKQFVAAVDKLVIGDPLDEATDIGTIVCPAQFEKVHRFIEMGYGTHGATPHECGVLPTAPHLKDGLFMRPVIFTGLDESSPLVKQEIFGPVCCVQEWDNYDDVIARANDSDFGLAATVWTNDMNFALNATRDLEAGFVQVNQALVVQPGLSYGGYKDSGVGTEASKEAMLEHFTHKKTIIMAIKPPQ